MNYQVQLTNHAKADLKRISEADLKVVVRNLTELEENPHKGDLLKGSLKGVRSLKFSLSGGEHRAVYYVITEDQTCLVFMVRPRERFYEAAERRYKALTIL